ncbi:MAG: hypothetical protein U5J98_02470 [Halobacteriales archaeon]|nr:hypothetical protein [Halobacteriales archaeon]
MATTTATPIRTDSDRLDARGVVLPAAYVAGVLATIAAATAVAYGLAGLTAGLGQFVLVAGGWLAVVSASPAVGERLARRLDRMDIDAHTPRSSKVAAAAAALLAR